MPAVEGGARLLDRFVEQGFSTDFDGLDRCVQAVGDFCDRVLAGPGHQAAILSECTSRPKNHDIVARLAIQQVRTNVCGPGVF